MIYKVYDANGNSILATSQSSRYETLLRTNNNRQPNNQQDQSVSDPKLFNDLSKANPNAPELFLRQASSIVDYLNSPNLDLNIKAFEIIHFLYLSNIKNR